MSAMLTIKKLSLGGGSLRRSAGMQKLAALDSEDQAVGLRSLGQEVAESYTGPKRPWGR